VSKLKPLFEELEKELRKRGVSLSYQRLMILEYITKHNTHPTAEEIFTALNRNIPTLSKATVYNNLRILTDIGLIKAVKIEDHETRYDLKAARHGHFKCNNCGNIYDFCLDIDDLTSNDLKGFQIFEKEVYFKGICPQCVLEKGNIKEEDDE